MSKTCSRLLALAFSLALSVAPALATGPAPGQFNITNVYGVSPGAATALGITPNTTGGVATYPAGSNTVPGVACNGSTDDTAAISAAITANPYGKLVFPPNSVCMVSGSASYIFTANYPVSIDCQGSTIRYSGTSTSTSMFHFYPLTSGGWAHWHVTRCTLDFQGYGAHYLVLDTSSSTLTEIYDFEIDHVTDTPSSAGSNWSIYVYNVSTNWNGGTYHVNFHDNTLFNGIYLNYAGDSIRIQDNLLTGAKYGIYANLITGAGGLLITGNNIRGSTPLLLQAAAGNTIITNNEFEQEVTNTDSDGAMVDIKGGIGAVQQLTFTGNSVNALTGFGNPYPLYLGNVTKAYVESNVLTTSISGMDCIINVGATTVLGAANQYLTCGAPIYAPSGSFSTVSTH